jgi:2-amino-4-hydroxy-6-hydroxymethyldihydropteridine diphosphokinase
LVECYVGLGSNVGDRVGMVTRALACLASQPDMVLGEVSGLYVTPAWGHTGQPDFVNAVCRLETHLAPGEVLSRLKGIEAGLGRQERFRWGPREIDLDILLYGDRVVDEAGLRVPHPMLHRRAFVLVPLADIAPHLIHPETGFKISEHLSEIGDRGDIECQSLDI